MHEINNIQTELDNITISDNEALRAIHDTSNKSLESKMID